MIPAVRRRRREWRFLMIYANASSMRSFQAACHAMKRPDASRSVSPAPCAGSSNSWLQARFRPSPWAETAAPGVAPPAGTRSRRQRAVFVCDDAGTPVFSDRPCGAAAQRRAVNVELPASGQATRTAAPVPHASTRPRVQPDGQRESAGTAEPRCAALRRQLDELDDRMRSGYSSREAARLWDRWRDLKSRLRAGRC